MAQKPTKPAVPGAVSSQELAAAGMISRQGVAGDDAAILHQLGDPFGLQLAVQRLLTYRDNFYPDSHPRHWAIVNFDLQSANPRLYLIDVVGQTVEPYLCAHGKGSERPSNDGIAEVFSNINGSLMTSLGIYRCAETFTDGHNRYAMALDGLQDTNSNARSRQIIMHPADYVTPKFAHDNGRIGRSEGCPALDPATSASVIDRLKFGSFLLHWKTP